MVFINVAICWSSVEPKTFSTIVASVYSPATTGMMSQRVMNLMSSSTTRFDGSAIATVSERPSRLSGITRCFCAISAVIIFAIFGSTSNRERSTAGMRCCFASTFVRSISGMKPIFTSV